MKKKSISFDELLVMGDFAVLELDREIKGITSFAKILVSEPVAGEILWVGGFGKQGPAFDHIPVSELPYQGRFVTLPGSHVGVSFGLKNTGSDTSYLGPGDSGGGVFKPTEDGFRLVGVNHGGFARLNSFYRDIQQDSGSGQVVRPPTQEGADTIGFVHYLNGHNQKLSDWLHSKLPCSSLLTARAEGN